VRQGPGPCCMHSCRGGLGGQAGVMLGRVHSSARCTKSHTTSTVWAVQMGGANGARHRGVCAQGQARECGGPGGAGVCVCEHMCLCVCEACHSMESQRCNSFTSLEPCLATRPVHIWIPKLAEDTRAALKQTPGI